MVPEQLQVMCAKVEGSLRGANAAPILKCTETVHRGRTLEARA